MPAKTAVTTGAGVNHLGQIRIKVLGDGNLKVNAISYNDFLTKAFSDIVMSETSDKILTSKGNFSRQRIQIEIKTEAIDEYMKFQHIIAFIKPIWASYPNG